MGWASVVGGLIDKGLGFAHKSQDYKRQKRHQSKEHAMQREFAQHGVRWKVEDARAAGIDPLAAMGSTTQYFPTNYQPLQQEGGSSFRQMGQDLSRAINSSRTRKEQEEVRQLQLESAKLDNDFKQIRNLQANRELLNAQSQNPTAFPSNEGIIPGQDKGGVKYVPNEIAVKSSPGISAGAHAAGTNYVHSSGYILTLPNKEAAEVLESYTPGRLKYYALGAYDLERGISAFKGENPKMVLQLEEIKSGIDSSLSKGYEALYDHTLGMWKRVKKKGGRRLFLRGYPGKLKKSHVGYKRKLRNKYYRSITPGP